MKNSVLFYGVEIAKGAVVEDSVIMPYARVEAGAVIRRAIVAENCVIGENCQVGAADGEIALVGQDTDLPAGFVVGAGEQIDAQEVAQEGGGCEMKSVMGIIYTNKDDLSLRELTSQRSVAALPLAAATAWWTSFSPAWSTPACAMWASSCSATTAR